VPLPSSVITGTPSAAIAGAAILRERIERNIDVLERNK
jgi:hypothetical protein